MAILDVAPVDEAQDLRSKSQYLPSVSDAPPIPPHIFIDSNPDQWRKEWNQAWTLAHELSTSLTSRAIKDGLVMHTDPATLRRPTSNSLLHRLVELLSITSKRGVDPMTMQSNFPQFVVLDYDAVSEAPKVINISSPRAMHTFLSSSSLMREQSTVSRLIFINLGRHDPYMTNDWNLDCVFDYSLVWLGALFEVLDITSDILLCASMENDITSNTFGEFNMQQFWAEHNLPPSAVREMETRRDPWRTWGFLVPFPSKRANHHTSQKLTNESPELWIRPTLLISHFHKSEGTSRARPWTGIYVASSSESFYLRAGDYPMEDSLDDAIRAFKFSATPIAKDCTKPMFHVFSMCIATLLDYLGEVYQFLISYERTIRMRPLEADGNRLFKVAKNLRLIENLSVDLRSSMTRFPRGDNCSATESWVAIAMKDLDFLDRKNQEMQVRLSETRTLLFNHVGILESQSISHLTKIAFVFVPATFVATVFGTNVSVFVGDGPSIGIFFAAAAGVCLLTWMFALEFGPLRVAVAKLQLHISRRLMFRRVLSNLKNARKADAKLGTPAELHQAALEEKKTSHLALTEIIERANARSPLQELVNAIPAQHSDGIAERSEQQVDNDSGH